MEMGGGIFKDLQSRAPILFGARESLIDGRGSENVVESYISY